MSVIREREQTFEDIRDKYFYLVQRAADRYSLDEEGLSELTIHYCEYIYERLGRAPLNWAAGLSNSLYAAAHSLAQQPSESLIVEYPLDAIDYFYEDYSIQHVEDDIFEDQMRDAIWDVVSTLTPEQEDVLRLRYLEDKTLEACSAILHTSRARICSIQNKALKKLFHPSRSQELKPFVYVDRPRKIPYLPNARQRDVFCYPYSNVVLKRVWAASGREFNVEIIEQGGYVISLSVCGSARFVDGDHLRICSFSDATRYKTLDDAIVAAQVLITLDAIVMGGEIVIPEPILESRASSDPMYHICQIVGTKSYVIRATHLNSHKFLNWAGNGWGDLAFAHRFDNPYDPAHMVQCMLNGGEEDHLPLCSLEGW